MDRVELSAGSLSEFLGDVKNIDVKATIAGRERRRSADIRAQIHADQVQSWFVVPIGVFVVLILTLRDPAACINLGHLLPRRWF